MRPTGAQHSMSLWKRDVGKAGWVQRKVTVLVKRLKMMLDEEFPKVG